jgi:hypothetical protein
MIIPIQPIAPCTGSTVNLASWQPSTRPITLDRTPLHAQPAQVAQLNHPSDNVGCNPELVIEYRCLIHFFPRFKVL